MEPGIYLITLEFTLRHISFGLLIVLFSKHRALPNAQISLLESRVRSTSKPNYKSYLLFINLCSIFMSF